MGTPYTLLIAVALVAAACDSGGDGVATTEAAVATQSTTTSTTSPPVEMSLQNEEMLELSLSSQDLDVFTSAFSPAVAAAILTLQSPMPQAGLPEGSTIDIDLATFTAGSAEVAVVNATVSGEEPQAWLLLLQKVGDQWLVYGTEKVRT